MHHHKSVGVFESRQITLAPKTANMRNCRNFWSCPAGCKFHFKMKNSRLHSVLNLFFFFFKKRQTAADHRLTVFLDVLDDVLHQCGDLVPADGVRSGHLLQRNTKNPRGAGRAVAALIAWQWRHAPPHGLLLTTIPTRPHVCRETRQSSAWQICGKWEKERQQDKIK